MSRVEVRVDVFEDGGVFRKGGRGSGGMGGGVLVVVFVG